MGRAVSGVLRTLAFTLSDLGFLEDLEHTLSQAHPGRRDGNRLGNKGRTQRPARRPLQQCRKEGVGADQAGGPGSDER